jgi:hypothetical protein
VFSDARSYREEEFDFFLCMMVIVAFASLDEFCATTAHGACGSVCEQFVPLSARDLIFTFTLGYRYMKLDCCSRLRADRIHQAKSVGFSYKGMDMYIANDCRAA